MANLTLVIDDPLLQRAREEALRSRTSVIALVRECLGHDVDSRSHRLASLDRFEAVANALKSSSSEPWSRESLHERS